MQYYDSQESAIDSVRKSKQWTALIFQPNYTRAMIERINSPLNASDDTIHTATVQEYADLTEFPIQVTIRQKFAIAQLRYVNLLIRSNPHSTGLPATVLTPLINTVIPPVYGSLDRDFRDFMAPGDDHKLYVLNFI